MSAMVCSAAAIVLPVGALTIMTPARVAASTSMRSIPTLATPTTLRRGAAAASSSASTRVCDRTTSASQPPSSASAASRSSRDRPKRTWLSWAAEMASSPGWATGSTTRMRAIAGPESMRKSLAGGLECRLPGLGSAQGCDDHPGCPVSGQVHEGGVHVVRAELAGTQVEGVAASRVDLEYPLLGGLGDITVCVVHGRALPPKNGQRRIRDPRRDLTISAVHVLRVDGQVPVNRHKTRARCVDGHGQQREGGPGECDCRVRSSNRQAVQLLGIVPIKPVGVDLGHLPRSECAEAVQECRHLTAGDERAGAVVVGAAPAGDARVREGIDVVVERMAVGYVVELVAGEDDHGERQYERGDEGNYGGSPPGHAPDG